MAKKVLWSYVLFKSRSHWILLLSITVSAKGARGRAKHCSVCLMDTEKEAQEQACTSVPIEKKALAMFLF